MIFDFRQNILRILSLCKLSVQRRETTKSCLIAYIHEVRKAYRHLANLMYREGLLPTKELIFFLTRDEIGLMLEKPSARNGVNKIALINRAQRRMRQYPTWNTHRFEEFHKGIIRPINNEEEMGDFTGAVTGTPVNEGVVTGRACVIAHFSDVNKIQAGDILITHSTDIGWSPYFPILAGVVTELGGLISHGIFFYFAYDYHKNVTFFFC